MSKPTQYRVVTNGIKYGIEYLSLSWECPLIGWPRKYEWFRMRTRSGGCDLCEYDTIGEARAVIAGMVERERIASLPWAPVYEAAK